MADKQTNYEKGQAFSKAIKDWFATQDPNYWNDKYGLSANTV